MIVLCIETLKKTLFKGCNILCNIVLYLYRENHIDYG